MLSLAAAEPIGTRLIDSMPGCNRDELITSRNPSLQGT
jgi:hypothetical protein